MKSTEKMALLPKSTIQRRSFFSTECSNLNYRKRICLKQLFFLFTFLLSFNLFSQTLGLERFKRSEGNMKYIVFNKLQDALNTYKEIMLVNGYFEGDIDTTLNFDEEVLLSSLFNYEHEFTMFFIATTDSDIYLLEVYTMPNDKKINVRYSQTNNGELVRYYFDPEEEEE
jgi:hypothetical protein